MVFEPVGIATLFLAELAVVLKFLEPRRLELLSLVLGRAEICPAHPEYMRVLQRIFCFNF